MSPGLVAAKRLGGGLGRRHGTRDRFAAGHRRHAHAGFIEQKNMNKTQTAHFELKCHDIPEGLRFPTIEQAIEAAKVHVELVAKELSPGTPGPQPDARGPVFEITFESQSLTRVARPVLVETQSFDGTPLGLQESSIAVFILRTVAIQPPRPWTKEDLGYWLNSDHFDASDHYMHANETECICENAACLVRSLLDGRTSMKEVVAAAVESWGEGRKQGAIEIIRCMLDLGSGFSYHEVLAAVPPDLAEAVLDDRNGAGGAGDCQ